MTMPRQRLEGSFSCFNRPIPPVRHMFLVAEIHDRKILRLLFFFLTFERLCHSILSYSLTAS